MKKSLDLIPLIIEAKNKESAINVLKEMLNSLYISNEYIEASKLVDQLKDFKKDYRETVLKYKKLSENIKNFNSLHDIRIELNLLYQNITDTLSFDVNRLKIYYEEYKTVQRSSSIISLKNNEEFQKNNIKATSTSALRDVVGADSEYNEYVTTYSIVYGLYNDLRDTLNSIRQLTDSIASEENFLRNVEKREAK